jgi:RNA polymerase sigma factor (sigma-70 family)
MASPTSTNSESFPRTRWTCLAQLTQPSAAASVLDLLCRSYWQPVFAYVRRAGVSHEDAQDVTQGFFEMLLRNEVFQRAEQTQGRLRSFLLGTLDNYLANHHRYESRQKRSGGHRFVSLTEQDQTLDLEAATITPEEAFDREWLIALLSEVMQGLREQYDAAGKGPLFVVLQPWLLEANIGSQAEAAEACELPLATFRVQVHRLRHRYREALREAILRTLACPEEIDEEISHLMAIMGRQH